MLCSGQVLEDSNSGASVARRISTSTLGKGRAPASSPHDAVQAIGTKKFWFLALRPSAHGVRKLLLLTGFMIITVFGSLR